jgi:hypothetical protein
VQDVRNTSLTVNTLLCSEEVKVECSGRTLSESRVTPVDAISLLFLINSVMSLMLASPGTNIRIAPVLCVESLFFSVISKCDILECVETVAQHSIICVKYDQF